jgi:hypothetical protein
MVRFLPLEDVPWLWYFTCYHSATSQHEYPTFSHYNNTLMLGGCATLIWPVQPWVAAPSPAWLCSIITCMTRHLHLITTEFARQHRHQHDSASTSRYGQVTPVALLLAWLNIYITPQPDRPGSTITIASMSRQHYRQHDSTAQSPAWLDIYIATRPSHPDNAVASWLNNVVARMTRQGHDAMAWSSTSTTYDFSGTRTCCFLIPVLFTDIPGYRANANVSLHNMAPLDTSIFWRFTFQDSRLPS